MRVIYIYIYQHNEQAQKLSFKSINLKLLVNLLAKYRYVWEWENACLRGTGKFCRSAFLVEDIKEDVSWEDDPKSIW